MTARETTSCQVEMNRHLQAAPERVWQALVEPEQVGTWFAASARISPERGGAYELFWQPETPEHNSTVGCRVTAIAASRHIAFTWRGPDELSTTMNEGDPPPPPTHVTITLTPTSIGTDVTVRHVGFGHDEGWSEAVAWHERSWTACLDNLEAFLDDQPLPHPWR
jgi:uncharacterized protein YndB with AHSA1/START domain